MLTPFFFRKRASRGPAGPEAEATKGGVRAGKGGNEGVRGGFVDVFGPFSPWPP